MLLTDFLVKEVGINVAGIAASLRSVQFLELIELCRQPADFQVQLLLQHEEILKWAALAVNDGSLDVFMLHKITH